MALPLNFASFDLKFSLVFETHVQTNGKPAPLLILVSRQVMVAFVFFRILVSVISLEQ